MCSQPCHLRTNSFLYNNNESDYAPASLTSWLKSIIKINLIYMCMGKGLKNSEYFYFETEAHIFFFSIQYTAQSYI